MEIRHCFLSRIKFINSICHLNLQLLSQPASIVLFVSDTKDIGFFEPPKVRPFLLRLKVCDNQREEHLICAALVHSIFLIRTPAKCSG